MKVYFSHGKESGPWGSKIKRLAEISKAQSLEVKSIDYSDIADPDLRVERLVGCLKKEQDDFLLVLPLRLIIAMNYRGGRYE